MTPEELAAINTRCDSTSLSLIGRDLPDHPDATFVEHARNDVTALLEEVERLHESEDEYAVLTDRLSQLLTQTAEALKGPPPPLVRHDWSDLPAVAKRMTERLRTMNPWCGPYILGRYSDDIQHADPCDCDLDEEAAGDKCLDSSEWTYGVFTEGGAFAERLIVRLPRQVPLQRDDDLDPLIAVEPDAS